MTQHDKDVFDLFKVIVLNETQKLIKQAHVGSHMGWATNFKPDRTQSDFLDAVTAPVDVHTLFTLQERSTLNTSELVLRQIEHYFSNYITGDCQGSLMINNKLTTLAVVRGVTRDDLRCMVLDLLYTNAPVKDANIVRNIIRHYNFKFDFDKIANNELRIALFNPKVDTLENGDDVVRYLVEATTGQQMVIKSKEVISQMTANAYVIPAQFISRHELPLANVFNRHKKLILSLKAAKSLRRAINRVTRLSKKAHKPVHAGINKRFLALALNDASFDMNVLDKISVRDKLKFLNVLGYKRSGSTIDAFIVRNGKIHVRDDRPVYAIADITRVEKAVIESLKLDLSALKNKNILLDKAVHYGLPVTRKQTIGNLPYGTTVNTDDRISSGIYWRNEWGATDLDLSTIDVNGTRTGWGDIRGYNAKDILFSGDVVDAYDGAMEFMTSHSSEYGIFVNIFRGKTGAKTELVIGEPTTSISKSNDQWMDKVNIREQTTLNSRGMVLGFVQGSKFVVYQGRMNNRCISGGKEPVVERGMAKWWTINELFDTLDIKYSIDKCSDTCYDYDLTYSGISYDKLEDILLKCV